MNEIFDQALIGEDCWVRATDGSTRPLPTRQWLGAGEDTDNLADTALTCCCDGPTIDLGCGPGRLVAALLRRGVVALGVDISPMAVAVTRFRGAPALHRDLFEPLPGTGRWTYALLADGNVGIGGDPLRLLDRTRDLLTIGGVAVVEFDRPGTGIARQQLRLETKNSAGPWFPWAYVGIEYAEALAEATGFRLRATAEVAGRHIAWLKRHPGEPEHAGAP
ncbi:methyltransferase domain-containing protein [Nocardia sp. 004]|uniref:methyltransferase domain-containing protein n=1 Tax=Nocardia sp. 004 TaxID=3385978 RepID=UPI0039A12E74